MEKNELINKFILLKKISLYGIYDNNPHFTVLHCKLYSLLQPVNYKMYSLLQTAYLYATNCTVVHCILYSLIQNVQLYTANCIVVRYKMYNCTLQTLQLFTISTYDLHSEPILIIVFFQYISNVQ